MTTYQFNADPEHRKETTTAEHCREGSDLPQSRLPGSPYKTSKIELRSAYTVFLDGFPDWLLHSAMDIFKHRRKTLKV